MATKQVLRGLNCPSYEACVEPVAETFGLSASSLSRRFKRASARKLAELQERDLSGYDLVGLFVDGKTFGDDELVIALGVTLSGEKAVLGFVQTATENEAVCTRFLRELVERGLKYDQGLLVVLDGAKGLRKAVDKVFGRRAAVQRCHWHKRENVLGYLPAGLKPVIKRKLNAAYEKPSYAAAKTALQRIRAELAKVNASAAASLDEGLEETLTLHRLGLFKELGRSFKTTNCIENVNALVGQRTDKVDCWRNADQKHRWLAATLLETAQWQRSRWALSRDDERSAAISICRGCVQPYRHTPRTLLRGSRSVRSRSQFQLGMALTHLRRPNEPKVAAPEPASPGAEQRSRHANARF